MKIKKEANEDNNLQSLEKDLFKRIDASLVRDTFPSIQPAVGNKIFRTYNDLRKAENFLSCRRRRVRLKFFEIQTIVPITGISIRHTYGFLRYIAKISHPEVRLMERLIRWILPIFILGILTSCATLSKNECLEANWFEIGRRDGVTGKPLKYASLSPLTLYFSSIIRHAWNMESMGTGRRISEAGKQA